MSINKVLSCVAICLGFATTSFGQAANSVFSQFGVGDMHTTALANGQGTPGLGISHPQSYYINNQNPALLVYNSFSTFQAGLLGESRLVSSSKTSERHNGGNMNYLALAVPMKHSKTRNLWGSSIGLMPYSTMKFQTVSKSFVEGQNTSVNTTLEGKGGLSELYWSNGVRITEQLSVGLKANYIFGLIDQVEQHDAQLSEFRTQVKDFRFEAGIAYTVDSVGSKLLRLSIGAVGAFNAHNSGLRSYMVQKNSQLGSLGDTLSPEITTRERGYTQIPRSINIGASVGRDNKWAIGGDVYYADWSNYSTLVPPSQFGLGVSYGHQLRVSFGGEVTPDIASNRLLSNITYRLGVTNEQYPYMVNGYVINDFGVNFGASIPMNRANFNRSSLDIGFKAGKRGNKAEMNIEESYFKVYLGFTFNDVWFIKRKFD